MARSNGRSSVAPDPPSLSIGTVVDELLSPTAPPQVLYHYCSGASLMGIVEGRKLWMGSACFLNDPLEWRWLPRVAVELLKKNYRPTVPAQRIGARRNGHWELLSMLEEREERDAERVGIFIASLTEKHDDLGQWRAYANDAKGYCVGFSTAALPIKPQKVIYSLERHREIAARIIDDAVAKDGRLKRQWGAEGCIAMMRRLQPAMKPPCYEQEAEWRMIVEGEMIPHWSDGKLSHPNANDIGLRLRGDSIVPYFKLALPAESVTSVTIGPQQPELDATRYALKLLLARNEFTNARIEIASSSIPYRSM